MIGKIIESGKISIKSILQIQTQKIENGPLLGAENCKIFILCLYSITKYLI